MREVLYFQVLNGLVDVTT